jgi:hypothetical protein
MAAATLMAAPYHPNLVPLPADWPDLPQLAISAFPFGAAYAGDRVSVSASEDLDPGAKKMQVRLDSPADSPLAEGQFFHNENSGKWTAQIPWMWDSSAQAGWHTLFLYIAEDPASVKGSASPPVQYPVQILPDTLRPELRRDARWQYAESGCCEYYYLSGTESERDIESLIAQTEKIYKTIMGKMGDAEASPGSARAPARDAPMSAKMVLLFLPRMYGQGGLATQEGVLSYMDRNPIGMDFSVVQEHEMLHLIAIAHFGDGLRAPLFLQEGWAVYLTGGHYRSPEALQARAAVLLRLGIYTPLADLANSFYATQHEAAYIEAGAFVEYLAGRFGRERTQEMFFDPAAAESPAAALDSMLGKHFQQTLVRCEGDWLESLQALAPDSETEQDVEFTMAILDSFRRYQQLYDPGGSMFHMWLPDTTRARSEQISADYLPSPATTESITLEILFRAARQSAWEGRWARAWELLEAAGRVLDAKQRRVPDPVSTAPAAEPYRALTSVLLRTGCEPLSIDLQGGQAAVETRDPKTLQKEEQHWHMIHGSWSRDG